MRLFLTSCLSRKQTDKGDSAESTYIRSCDAFACWDTSVPLRQDQFGRDAWRPVILFVGAIPLRVRVSRDKRTFVRVCVAGVVGVRYTSRASEIVNT